jgi:hypothetical protein
MTSAMAIVFCVMWLVWSLQSNGPIGGFLKHIFGYSGDATGFMRIGLMAVFLAVVSGSDFDRVPSRIALVPSLRQHFRG